MTKRKNPHVGGLFEDWLKEEGIYEPTTNAAIKKVVAWQIEQAMQEQKLTRTERLRKHKRDGHQPGAAESIARPR